jgi:hypothetical protein
MTISHLCLKKNMMAISPLSSGGEEDDAEISFVFRRRR